MKITIVSGARPNFMKIAPLCRAIDAAREAGKNISYRIVYTGPQDDTTLDASLFSDLAMPKPDAYLGISGRDHSRVAASIMLAFEEELNGHPAQVVLVVDDMTATMSCAIVAKKRGLKVAHVIAGTRSFDMNMPREVNRTIVDAISDYLFTAGMVANRNLNQEGMIPEYIHAMVLHPRTAQGKLPLAHPEPPRPAGKESRTLFPDADAGSEGWRHACRGPHASLRGTRHKITGA